jgi:hypothetical protein
VLYLTPIVFHQAAFSAQAVTQGLALAALAGTAGRFLSGMLLERGLACSIPVLLAALAALLGDLRLFGTASFPGYVQGQLLIGIAAGLYWPAVELAVPLGCRMGPAPIPTARGYALVRSADAAGIAAGALLGALLAAAGRLRGIYLIDIICLLVVVVLLLRQPLQRTIPTSFDPADHTPWRQWLPPLLPLLAISLLATSLPALMQSMEQIDQMLYRYPRGATFFLLRPANRAESYRGQRRSHTHAPRLYLQRYWRRPCQSQPPSQFHGAHHSIDWGIAY